MRYFLLLVIVASLCYTACRPDETFVDVGTILRLEVDTMRFDTVFTQVGSITRSVKIYNDQDDVVLINSINLRQQESFFRLNVDGYQAPLEDIRIAPRDSIYLFCEVTIDPDQPLSSSPFVIEDYVDIDVNGATTTLTLEAFGQNANYIQLNNPASASLLACDFGSVVWDDPRPYVIYGILVIDSCELIIPAGADVFLHGGLVRQDSIFYSDGLIAVLSNGQLTTQGTVEEPVTIQSDRLESAFDDVSGQWNGIRILAGSTDNTITHTRIQHPITGILVDSAADLTISNSSIEFASAQGLVARNATLGMTNCLIHSTVASALQLTYGGDYTIRYSTLASYGNQAPAASLANNFCVDPLDLSTCRSAPLRARFTNTVVTGNDKDEILLSDITNLGIGEVFDYQFDHCAITVEDLLEDMTFVDNLDETVLLDRRDTLFANIDRDDYRPDSLSILEAKAMALPDVLTDLEGNSRDASQPDIGAYEYQY